MRKSIIFVIDYMTIGGVEKVLIEAIKQLKSEYNLTLFVLNGSIDQYYEKELSNYCEIVKCNLDMHLYVFLSYVSPRIAGIFLRKHIKKTYDICINVRYFLLHMPYAGIAKKYIYWDHTDRSAFFSLKHNLTFVRKVDLIRQKMLYSKYTQIWVLNEEMKKYSSDIYKSNNIRVLNNPIDCKGIISKSNSIITDYQYNEKDLTLLYVGRLSEEKGVNRLIDSCIELKKENKLNNNFKLLIIGSGTLSDSLRDLVVSNHLFDSVIFLGSKKNPYCYMKQANCLILPSSSESFGLVLLEAMILNVPVVATNTVGAKDVLKNGKYGVLIDNTQEAVKSFILDFNFSSKEYFKYKNEAYNYAWKYDVSEFAKSITSYINEAIND